MTIAAKVPLAAMAARIDWKILIIVVPGCLIPAIGIVAGNAVSRETRPPMVGVGCPVIIRLMAGQAFCRGIIVTRCVAGAAGNRHVSAG